MKERTALARTAELAPPHPDEPPRCRLQAGHSPEKAREPPQPSCALGTLEPRSLTHSGAGDPVGRRCSPLAFARYARSSRLGQPCAALPESRRSSRSEGLKHFDARNPPHLGAL